jgi:hypothetical protein
MSSSGLLGWFAAISALAVASRWSIDGRSDGHCRLDGVTIEPVRRVDLLDGPQVVAGFCSIDCALAWPEQPASPSWQLRDEVTGRPVDANRAAFVTSRVAGVPGRGGRIHVFALPDDAERHCARFGGAPLRNPFADRSLPSSQE